MPAVRTFSLSSQLAMSCDIISTLRKKYQLVMMLLGICECGIRNIRWGCLVLSIFVQEKKILTNVPFFNFSFCCM